MCGAGRDRYSTDAKIPWKNNVGDRAADNFSAPPRRPPPGLEVYRADVEMFLGRRRSNGHAAGAGSEDDDFDGGPNSVFSALSTMQADHINSAVAEVRQSGGKGIKNTNSALSNWDQVSYGLENRIAANGAFPLMLLAFVTSFVLGLFGVLWYRLSSDTAELVLDGVWVPDDQLLGTPHRGFYETMKNFQNERMVLVGMGVGAAQKALDMTFELSLIHI